MEISGYEKIVVFLNPIKTKMGNVVVEQSFMPTICRQMQLDTTFLINERIKKIAILTAWINKNNEIEKKEHGKNSMQKDINSLNTLNFDVIPLFKIKNLSTETKFNTLIEYLEMKEFLQKKGAANAQNPLLQIENNILIGDFEPEQYEGEFEKSFCFAFFTAILAGGNDYKYDISKIITKFPKNKKGKLSIQLENLRDFIDYANKNIVKQTTYSTNITDVTVLENEDISSDIDVSDINRMPEKGFDCTGRRRYKTQRKVRDTALQQSNYFCDCHDFKHFYFEAVDSNQYVEAHHIVPMNRQEEYYFGKNVNLDIIQNMVAVCPTCHKQVHVGSRNARIEKISEIYAKNRLRLLSFDPDITLSLLASYYNIGLESEEERLWLDKANQLILQKQEAN